jgi:hypothetical protein
MSNTAAPAVGHDSHVVDFKKNVTIVVCGASGDLAKKKTVS